MKFGVPHIGAFATALLLAGSISVAHAQGDKVRVGAYASISDAGLYIAKDKGYFAEQGINVEIAQVNTGTEMTSQLANGDLDASGGAPGAGLYNAVRQGIELKIVADKGSSLPGHGYFAFVVRKELADKIKEPADMRGRLLAVTGYGAGAPSEVTIHKLLESGGVKESEINQVNMQFADIAAALGTGKVDIGVLIEPLVSQVVNKGIAVVWKRVDTVYPDQQYGALMYGPGIMKRPDVANASWWLTSRPSASTMMPLRARHRATSSFQFWSRTPPSRIRRSIATWSFPALTATAGSISPA